MARYLLPALTLFLLISFTASCSQKKGPDVTYGKYVDPEGAPVPTQARVEAEYLQNQLDARDRYIAKLERDLKAIDALGEIPDFTSEVVRDGKVQESGDSKEMAVRDIRLDFAGDPDKEGFRILLLDAVMFDSGMAEIKPRGKKLLRELAENLRQHYPNRHIVVRGHTDSEPIQHSQYRSNWELGAARSLNVLHFLITECGLSAEKISAQSFGKFQPVSANATPQGKQMNRRTELAVMPVGFAIGQ
ncbi:MAG: flagellar motor protein MotB [Candidatus Sumerlaeia bacterium]